MSDVFINYDKVLKKTIKNLNYGDYFMYNSRLYRIISTKSGIETMMVDIPNIEYFNGDEQVIEVDIEVTVKYKK